jgi:hypothetical protein
VRRSLRSWHILGPLSYVAPRAATTLVNITLPDGGAYHFPLDQPLHPDVLAASRAARIGGDELPWPQREQWHDDQLQLLRERA